jgi:hypothetical protein
MNIQVFANKQFYFLFFTNFETFIFSFIFHIHFLEPILYHLTKLCDLKLWNPSRDGRYASGYPLANTAKSDIRIRIRIRWRIPPSASGYPRGYPHPK